MAMMKVGLAMNKVGLKDAIIFGLCTLLIILLYFGMIHTPTAMVVQNARPNRLNCYSAPDTDYGGQGSDSSVSDGGESSPKGRQEEVLSLSESAANLATGVNSTASEVEFPGLKEILEKAALPNKTILLTTLNAAWAVEDSMIDLFLGSFHAGEAISHYLNHLIIIALDQVSFDRCRQIHQHCFRLQTEGVDFAAEKFFMSEDYLKMLWRRLEFLRVVLELGYDLLFSDADIMWFRDPFPQLSKDADFQIACDFFRGSPTALNNLPNGGFLFARSRPRTIEFYKYWHESRVLYPTKHDQDVFNSIKGTSQFADLGLKLEFLDTAYFGGFCEKSRDFGKVCTMHANCCTGLERKLSDLKLVALNWAQYRALTPKQREVEKVSWQAPKACLNSWKKHTSEDQTI